MISCMKILICMNNFKRGEIKMMLAGVSTYNILVPQ